MNHTKGIVFNIQKFSLHDGPGIRTTVFFKGCPLKCLWCANPESQALDIQILWDKSKCVHCLMCTKACPTSAIYEDNQQIRINHNHCIHCLQCVNQCPNQALSNEGETKTVNEIIEVCLQDKDFYEESDGGVTFSGGEALSQPMFIKALAVALKKENIHLALETTGYIDETIFQETAPLFDLLLFDVKHFDREKHFNGTNVYNDLIIKNLKWAINQHINILPRIPVIPHFNQSLEDAKGIALLLKKIGLNKAQLLPFHQFGEKKYEMLHMIYQYKDEKALYKEELIDYQKIFINQGIDCFF